MSDPASTLSTPHEFAAITPAELPLEPVLTVVYHPDLTRVGDRARLGVMGPARRPCLSRNEPLFAPRGRVAPLPLGDPYLSRTSVQFHPLPHGGLRLVAPPELKAEIDGLPLSEGVELPFERLRDGVLLGLARRVTVLVTQEPVQLAVPIGDCGMVGTSTALDQVRLRIEQVADLAVPVLLRGETGCGKELCARAIHERSPRGQAPWVPVNLGAVPHAMAAAELFGYARGAFTGATRDHRGFFARSDRGTLFLDEVGAAQDDLQVALLRVLDTGEIQPVGGADPRRVDVRLIAATDADLQAAVEEGRFRAALWHRLAGYQIRVPPLRARRSDIAPVFMHFLREELRATGDGARLECAPGELPWLPRGFVEQLVHLGWPGNLRQLRNVARHVAIAHRGLEGFVVDSGLAALLEEARGAPASPTQRRPLPPAAAPGPPGPPDPASLLAALEANHWEVRGAARALGVAPNTLYKRLQESDLLPQAGKLSPAEIAASRERQRGDLPAMARELRVSLRALRRRLRDLGLPE